MDMMETAAQAREIASGGDVPEWVHILPAGHIEGRDGRSFELPNPATVVDAFAANGADLPVDFEHQADNPAAKAAGPIRAAGWIKGLKATAEGVFARIEWTARAREMIAAREYRYISPVLRYNRETRRIGGITGAGLVHKPNLHLTALSAAEGAPDIPAKDKAAPAPGEAAGAALADIARGLGLDPATAPEEIAAGVLRMIASFRALYGKMTGKAAPEATALMEVQDVVPDPARYMPALAFEELVRDHGATVQKARDQLVTQKVEKALAEGHLTQGMKQWATALCRSDEAAFDAYCSGVPRFAYLFGEVIKGRPAVSGRSPADPTAESVEAQLGLKPGTLSR